MSLIRWEEKYTLDVQEIDEQHERLFLLFNELDDSIEHQKGNQVLMNQLNDLINYTRLHFTTEEKLMQQFSYVGYLEHKRVHDDLMDEALDLKEKFGKGQIELSGTVSNFLTGWLTEHILDMDKKYSALFKSNGIR